MAEPTFIMGKGLTRSIPWIITSYILVISGTALRLWNYLLILPLRTDEVRLALNIIDRSYTSLIEPLDHGQAAPIGILYGSKLIVDLAGENEHILRLIPMICGILGIWVFWLLVRRYFFTIGGIIVLAAVSLSPTLIDRAADMKQYSSDFLMTSAMILVAFSWFTSSQTLGRWLTLTCVGSVCIWFSHPGVFIVAAVGLVWLVELIPSKNREGMAKLSTTLIIWLLVIVTAYLFNMRYSAGHNYLQMYWKDSFMPTSSALVAIQWVVISLLKIPTVAGFDLGRAELVALAFFAFVGQITLLKMSRSAGLSILLMILIPLAAAMLSKYPFSGRTIIFLLPCFFILLAEGLTRIFTSPRWSGAGLFAMYVILMFPFTSQGFGGAAVGSRFDMPSAMKYLSDHVSEDESVLMMDNLIFPYEYYKRRFDTAFKVVFLQSPRNEKISDESAQSALMQGAGENGLTKGLWVVVGNVRWVRRGLYDNPREHIHAALNRMGHVTDMIEFHNITIFYLKEMIKHN